MKHLTRFAILFSILSAFVGISGVTVAQESATAELTVCTGCEISTLAEALAQANDGDVILVEQGDYDGGVEISKSVHLLGIDQPVIDGHEEGTILHVTAPGVVIDGFTITGTGKSHDKEDSAVTIDAPRATISNNLIEDALFGIYVRDSAETVIRGNTIRSKDVSQPLRGDGIKVWYSDDVRIEDNIATDGRDMILWYSNRATLTGNTFDRNRYGMHLMYSDSVHIENNSLNDNAIGLYIMYSRDAFVVGNSLSNNHGASGGGLGLKDVDGAVVEGNRFVNNQIGVQVDNSPRERDVENYFIGNVFAFNEVGLGLLPAVRQNTLTDNAFIDNGEHVAILGRGQLQGITWAVDGSGNYWSDYAGYDEQGDGIGDLPYVSQHLFESLISDYPELRLFSYSPASMAIDFAAEALPSFRPEVKFEDPSPLMTPPISAYLPAIEDENNLERIALGSVALAGLIAAGVAAIALRRPRRWQTGDCKTEVAV